MVVVIILIKIQDLACYRYILKKNYFYYSNFRFVRVKLFSLNLVYDMNNL